MRRIVFFIFIMFSVSCKEEDFKAEVFAVGGGYGYHITKQGKILIRQESVPAEPGNKKFCDSLDALKVGNEVIKLLHKGKIPAITKDDLKRLDIKLKC